MKFGNFKTDKSVLKPSIILEIDVFFTLNLEQRQAVASLLVYGRYIKVNGFKFH